jgi:chromosome segregation ATPase
VADDFFPNPMETLERRVKALEAQVFKLTQGATQMALDFTGLQNEVTKLTTAVTSTVKLLQDLQGQIKTLAGQASTNAADQATLNDMVAKIDAQLGALTTAEAPPAP